MYLITTVIHKSLQSFWYSENLEFFDTINISIYINLTTKREGFGQIWIYINKCNFGYQN